MSGLPTSNRPRRSGGRLALIAVILGATLPVLNANAQVATSTLELRAGTNKVKVVKYRGEPIYLDLGVYVAALGGPFEVWLTRPDYSQPIQAEQALYAAGGTSHRSLPEDALNDWLGFKDFFHIDVGKDGEDVKSAMLDFCPNSYDRQRVNDQGPDTVSYPDSCSANPFTRGLVWGIDEGWAASMASSDVDGILLPQGTYDVTVSIDQRFVDLFEIPTDASSVDLELTVEKQTFTACRKCSEGAMHRPERAAASVPITENPDPATLPDLISLPAWNITVHNGKKRERISFSAAVWAAGAESMVVEGFRRQGEELMDAYQYFYKDGEPVGRAPVGSLDYDPRVGHEHWHFLQFARYSLLDESMTEVLLSKKEAFCLAPTDAIDLTIPNAEWSPYDTGLSTACGSQTAVWVREVLPLGWGDTYYQGIPGQSLNITDLPNGTYYIQVTANPLGSLYEQTDTNNTELREIIIKGKAGKRKVEVPLWNGIDTETQDDGEEGVLTPHDH